MITSLQGYTIVVGEDMNTRLEKERVRKTTLVYAVVMALIVILILFVVQDPKIKAIAIVLILLIGCAAIIVQWLLIGKREQQTEQALEAEASEAPVQSPQTGAPCEVSGQYHCSEHPQRKVAMVEGRRFPPCRGNKKGHSATWILEQ